jgi:hypothetical protein
MRMTTRLVGQPGYSSTASQAGGTRQTEFDCTVVDIQPEPLPHGLHDRALGHTAQEHRAAQLDPLGEFVNGGRGESEALAGPSSRQPAGGHIPGRSEKYFVVNDLAKA